MPDAASEVFFKPAGHPHEGNGRVEKWMKRFMTDQKPEFQTFLGREGIYEGMIREKLHDRGMPEDLLYLAMIESGFSPKATSKASAVGVWQFMGPTALQYGLRVDEWVDERRDPVKGTDAALDYLEVLHARYDSWFLAAAAYNSGPGTVDKAVKRHAAGRIGDEDIYWEIIDHLPRETREYVPKLLAATQLARQAERYGFKVKPVAPYEYDRVWVPGATSLALVAKKIGTDTRTMRELNPHLVMGWTPPGSSYGLRVPKGRSDEVIAALTRRRVAPKPSVVSTD
jgi:membrane-bound lytic murein transglycosylase D